MKRSRRFPAEPAAVPAARRFAAGVLDGCDEETAQAAVLMVSELATNCILHAGGGFKLAISRGKQEIRVEASDQRGGQPQMRSPAPTDPHGRGLRIVDALASAWGVEHHSRQGKTVWFTLALPAGAGGASRSPAAAART